MSETRFILCPYCGHPQPLAEKCAACGGFFEHLSRKATQIAMGPWFIRDHNLPFRPGCSFEILHKQILAGKVKANTVMRGPTTHQFWSVARNTPGVSHLLGYCHECNATVNPTDSKCGKCSAKFTLPVARNELGLLYPTTEVAVRAQKSLDKELKRPPGQTKPADARKASGDSSTSANAQPEQQGSIDLLDQVLSANPASKKSSSRSGSSSKTSSAAGSTAAAATVGALDFTPAQSSGAEAEAAQKAGESGMLWKDKQGIISHDPHETAPVPKQIGAPAWIIWLLVGAIVVLMGLMVFGFIVLRNNQA